MSRDLKTIDPKEIKGFECVNAVYAPSNTDPTKDIHVVKEKVHLVSGEVIPNVRIIHDFQRDYYITKPAYRKHQYKKEWEDISKLDRFTTNQAQLVRHIARNMGRNPYDARLPMLSRSPYLYGTDISSESLIKKKYMDRFPDCYSVWEAAVLDIETDVVHGTEDILSVGLTFKDKVCIAVNKKFYNPHNLQEKIDAAVDKYLKKYRDERKLVVTAIACDTPAECVYEVIMKAHEWRPDFIAIWNMNFDIPKILDTLRKEGWDPADVFSDPAVPLEHRFCRYKEASKQKVTASGKVMSMHPADLWHVLFAPASFYVIDSMCLFKRIRVVEGQRPSYSLDAILGTELDLGKLRFKEADEYSGLAWHVFMQTNYKLEYLVYNIFDCIGVELLEEKTLDIGNAFRILCSHSTFARFSSTPRRLADDLHFYAIEKRNQIIASTADQMEDDVDPFILTMDGWINSERCSMTNVKGHYVQVIRSALEPWPTTVT